MLLRDGPYRRVLEGDHYKDISSRGRPLGTSTTHSESDASARLLDSCLVKEIYHLESVRGEVVFVLSNIK